MNLTQFAKAEKEFLAGLSKGERECLLCHTQVDGPCMIGDHGIYHEDCGFLVTAQEMMIEAVEYIRKALDARGRREGGKQECGHF